MMNAPIFVVGTPRSGTTLIARIIGKHSRIFMPGETHIFDDIYAKRLELGPLTKPATCSAIFNRLSTIYERYNEINDQKRIDSIFEDPFTFSNFTERCKTYENVYSWFFEIQMRYEGKSRWGNQVPRDIFNVSEILEFFPDAKFIVCIRDIKDFLVSYKYKWRTAELEKNKKRLKSLYHPIITSMLWKSSHKHIKKLINKVPINNYLIVPYEKMVQAPEQTIRKICDCIGEPFEHAMLSIDFNNTSFQNSQKGIFNTSIGRWRTDLTAEEVVVAQKIAARELRIHGYAIIPLQYSKFKMLNAILSAPVALIRGIKANKELRGSTLKYLVKRLQPLFT